MRPGAQNYFHFCGNNAADLRCNEIATIIMLLSGYHADTPITIKAEASSKADSRIH